MSDNETNGNGEVGMQPEPDHQPIPSDQTFALKRGEKIITPKPPGEPGKVLEIPLGKIPDKDQQVIDEAFAVLKALEGCAWEGHGNGILILTRCGQHIHNAPKELVESFTFCPWCAKRIIEGREG